MMIVVNEYECAEKAIKDRELGRKPSETLTRIAKYYLHEGYSKKEVAGLLEDFIIRCDPGNSVEKWSDTIERVIKSAIKKPLVIIDSVPITESEMEKVNNVKSRQGKRLAFTLLCIAKYMNLTRNGGYWVNTPDSDIMSMANINTSVKRQSILFGQLRDEGLIGFSKKIDNLNVHVLFADDSSPIAVEITDFRNLGNQYLKLCGEDYFECQCCGLTIKQNTGPGRRQKYCQSCAAKIRVQQTVNSVMRQRTVADDGMRYTVYMHVFPDGKRYIGMTKNELARRWQRGNGYRGQEDIFAAIGQCGWDNVRNFVMFEDLDFKTARSYEAQLIDEYRTYSSKYGFNTHYSKYTNEIITSTLPKNFSIKEVDGYGTTKTTNVIKN